MTDKTLHETVEDLEQKSRHAYGSAILATPTNKAENALRRIQKEELDNAKQEAIAQFAQESETIANVVNGTATFSSYAQPILDHITAVEERYRNRRWGIVSKKKLLGKDTTFPTAHAANEAIQYLKDERIIDPEQRFETRLLYPGMEVYNFIYDNPIMIPPYMIGSLSAGISIGYLVGGVKGAVAGGICGAALPLIALAKATPANNKEIGLLAQRDKFEKSVTSLDTAVTEYFHNG